MGSSKAIKTIKLFEDVQMDQDQTSSEIDVSRYDSASINVIWDNTLTPIGELIFQVRNGDDDDWFDLNAGETIVVPTVAPDDTDKFVLNITELDFKWIRLFYDRTSGDGTISAVMFCKSEGV